MPATIALPVKKQLYTMVLYFKDNTQVTENFNATCHTEANNIAIRAAKTRKAVHYDVGLYVESDEVKDLRSKARR